MAQGKSQRESEREREREREFRPPFVRALGIALLTLILAAPSFYQDAVADPDPGVYLVPEGTTTRLLLRPANPVPDFELGGSGVSNARFESGEPWASGLQSNTLTICAQDPAPKWLTADLSITRSFVGSPPSAYNVLASYSALMKTDTPGVPISSTNYAYVPGDFVGSGGVFTLEDTQPLNFSLAGHGVDRILHFEFWETVGIGGISSLKAYFEIGVTYSDCTRMLQFLHCLSASSSFVELPRSTLSPLVNYGSTPIKGESEWIYPYPSVEPLDVVFPCPGVNAGLFGIPYGPDVGHFVPNIEEELTEIVCVEGSENGLDGYRHQDGSDFLTLSFFIWRGQWLITDKFGALKIGSSVFMAEPDLLLGHGSWGAQFYGMREDEADDFADCQQGGAILQEEAKTRARRWPTSFEITTAADNAVAELCIVLNPTCLLRFTSGSTVAFDPSGTFWFIYQGEGEGYYQGVGSSTN